CRVGAEPVPDAGVEEQCERNPDPRPSQGFAHADDVRLPMKDPDVERKQCNDERNETAPKEQGLIHQRLLLITVRESPKRHSRVETVFRPSPRPISPTVSRSVRF